MSEKPYFVKDIDPSWKESVSLEELVIKMVENGQQNTPEFQALLRGFGRQKLAEIWRNHLKEKKK